MSSSEENDCIVSNIEINLIEKKDIYELDDSIQGFLLIDLKRELNVNLIHIKYQCVGQVQWNLDNVDQNKSNGEENDENCLTEQENFLDIVYDIAKNYKSVLEPGSHKIPFKFENDDKKLPSSFKDEKGYICYFISASVYNNDGEKILIKTNPCYVTVQIPVDRNDLNLPIGANAHKKFGHLCFRKGKIHIYAYIAKKGFYPGDTIPVDIQIVNKSSAKLHPRVTLSQTKGFFFKNKKHIVEHHYEKVEGSLVLKGNDIKETINIKIPDTCVLSMYTSIIVVKYFCHITCNISREFDVHLNLPITITTKKFIEQHAQQQEPQSQS